MRRPLAVVLIGAGAPERCGAARTTGSRSPARGSPFRHIDRLRRGDRIAVAMANGTFRHAVERTRIAERGDRCSSPLVASSSTLARSASDERPERSSDRHMEPDSHPQRRAPRGHAPNPMIDDPSMRAMHINQLKERIERSAYAVDADAVAEALLRRPAARRSILPPVSRPGARTRSANGSRPQR